MHRRLALVVLPALCAVVGATSATATQQRTTSSLAAAPFAQSWAHVPQTQAARQAKDVLVFGQEQDIDGFNTVLTCCNSFWAAVTGNVPELRGAYNITSNLKHVLDLVSSAKATSAGLSYTIRPDANWYWGGKKLPVTYKDFVYTWQQIDNPANDLAGRTGYSNLDPVHFTHKGQKQVTFRWKTTKCTTDFPCGAYANWQALFSGS